MAGIINIYTINIRAVISRLKSFFEKEQLEGSPTLLQSIMERMATATGIRRSTLYKLLTPEEVD